MAYGTATLTGFYQTFDGQPASGVVEIIPNSRQLVDTEGNAILSGRVKVTLVETTRDAIDDDGNPITETGGAFSVTLPATDDATVEPATGRQYTVVAKLRHTHLAAVTGVELATGATVDVADLASAPVVDPLVSTAATTAQLDALEASLSPVATSGAYSDLTGAPTIPATAADVGAEPAGTAAALDASLAPVAKSGAYTDLTGKPTIPTTAADVGALPDTMTAADIGGQPAATLDADTAARVNDTASQTRAALSATIASSVPALRSDTAALSWFHAALAGRHGAAASIALISHSFGEGAGTGAGAPTTATRWWERFQAIMRQRFPLYDGSSPKGRGFIPAYYESPNLTDPVVTGGTVVKVTTQGPGGRTLYMNPGRTLTYTLQGTSVDVGYVKGSGNGTITVSIDGVAQTPIDTNAASFAPAWQRYSLGASGSHTVAITSSVSGVYVMGVIEYDGNESKGLQFIEAGHFGWKASDHNAVSFRDQQWGIAAPPRLVLVELGINEWVNNVTPAAFRTALDALVAWVRTISPSVPIVFVADYQNYGTYNYQWSEYVQVYKDCAAANTRTAVCDLSWRMPRATSANDGFGTYIVGDGHPTEKGALMMAQYVAEFISPR